ncbi:hypothetical protein NU219Hw_g7827t1 [Hortaea werneckii]
MVLEELSVNLPRATSSQPGPAAKPARTPSTSNAAIGNAGSLLKGASMRGGSAAAAPFKRPTMIQPSGRKSTSPIPEEDELLSVAEKPSDGVLLLGSAPNMKRKKKTGSAASAKEVVYKHSDRMSNTQAPRPGAVNVNRSNGGVPAPAASSHVLKAGSDNNNKPLRKKSKTANAQADDVDGEGSVPVIEAPASLQSGPQRARSKGKAKELSPKPEESESKSSGDDETGSEDKESEFEGSGNDNLSSEDEECVGDKDIDPKKEQQELLDD